MKINLGSRADKSKTVMEVMTEIVTQCNNELQRTGRSERVGFDVATLELNGSAHISWIKNMPGYTIGSLLGLTSGDKGKEKYCVDTRLVYDPNDVSFKNLTLSLTSEVQSGDAVDILAKYGVFGVTVSGDLSGASCEAKYIVKADPQTGEWNLKLDSNVYSGGVKKLDVHSTDVLVGTTGSDLLGSMNLNSKTGFYPIKKWTLDAEDPDSPYKYGPYYTGSEYPGLSMSNVYDLLHEVVSDNLLKAFYDNSFLANLKLPMQGKSVLDIMGLRGKINEMAKCLEQGNCTTLPELKQYFAQNLGVTLKFTLSTEGVGIDIEWVNFQLNQVTELGGMDFGLEGFNLGGSLEAYLNSQLTMFAHIDIVYDDASYTATLDTSEDKLYVDGYVWLSAGNVVTDMNVCVLEGTGDSAVSRQKVFEVGDDAAKRHSNLFMLANVGVVDWPVSDKQTVKKQAVALRLGGTLHTSRYGISTGDIKIGVADSNLAKNNTASVIPCAQWDNDSGNFDNLIWCIDGVPLKSVAVWNAEDNSRYLTDGINVGNVIVDLTGINESLDEVQLYDMLKQVADGLSDTVRRAQSGLNSVLLKKTMRSIPLVGDTVVNVADCLTSLESDFVEKFRKYVYNATGLDARAVAEKLYSLLNLMLPTGDDKLNVVSDTASEYWAGKLFDQYYKGIQYYENDTEAGWRIRLHGSYVLEENGTFDLGYPGLGLKADGGVEIGLEWTLDVGFGISIKDGAFLLLSNGHEADDTASEVQKKIKVGAEGKDDFHAGDDLKIKLTIKPTANMKGSLGFLAMNGWLAQTDYTLRLGLDLNDGDNSQEDSIKDWVNDASANRMIIFNGLKSGISVEGNLRGEMTFDINLTLGIGGFVNTAPHIDTTLKVDWSSDVGEGFGSVNEVSFNDITLDAGTFVHNTFGDVIGKIKSALKPIQPLIDFLQAEIPVLNKLPAGGIHITVLDLIKKYGDGKNMNFGFLDDIIALNSVINKLDTFTNKGIYIGDWELYSASRGEADPLNATGLQYMKGMVHDIDGFISSNYASYANLFSIPKFVNKATFTGNVEDYVKNLSTKGFDKSTATPMTSFPSGINGNWLFPLIDKNTAGHEIMKLLMGGHADLVKFDLAPLKFDFDWRKSFPIVGPLCADIGFNFGVCIDLCFGYDTYGIEGWMKSGYKDAKCLVNGFYIDDLNDEGKDVAEVVFHSGIVAGASVCGRAGINVGLNFNVNMDFKDPNYDGKIRLKELADMLSLNPLDMFDFSATIEARAFAYLDLCLYRKEWTLWSSGAFDLFTTASKVTRTQSLVSNQEDAVYVNIGDFASNRGVGDTSDGSDEVTITIIGEKRIKVSYGGLDEEADVDGKPLCIYAGEYNDTVTIISGVKDDNSAIEADFDIIIDGENGDDTLDMAGAFLSANHFAMIVGGAGCDIIKGANGGMTIMIGGSAYVSYEYDEKKIIKGVKKAFSFPDATRIESNIIFGGVSSNYIFGGFGADVIVGGVQDDYIFGDDGRITFDDDGKFTGFDSYDLYDEGGADVIFGLAGNDHIFGGAENDSIDAGSGNDVVYAGQGNDVVYGGEGNDQIHGGDGVDVIFGDTPVKAAMLIAEQGDENAAGVLPYNYISKEIKNTDSALYSGEFVKDTEMPVYGKETTLQTDAGSIQLYDFLKKYESGLSDIVTQIRNLVKADKQKSVAGEPCYNDVIYGENGSDIIFGDDGSDGTAGNDFIYGGAGNDFIDGDAGNDKVDGDSGDDIIYGGKGNDVLDGGAHNDIVMGDDGWESYELIEKTDSWFENDESDKVFGDTAKAFGLNFKINETTRLKKELGESVAGGADTIISGNGNDIIDGQGGNDSYNVNFMGDYYSAYTNILESGSDSADSLVINGTISNDDILIRASDVGLGMIALLPNTQQEIQEAKKNDEMANKTRMERINYWNVDGKKRGVEKISLNTGAGSDRINVDSSLSSMSVDAGAGNDTINIGQQFESNRNKNDTNKIADLDSFGNSTILTTQGYVSEGVCYASSFTGGDGDDVFNVLHTAGPISLSGGNGNDRFNVGSYIGINSDETTYQVKNGPMSIIGGVGDDSMSINGTESDDTFVFTEGTVLSANVDVQAIGVENQDVCGGDGDDSFYVLDTVKDSVISIKGNNGNDSFYNGGVQFKADAEKVIDISGGQKEETASEPIDIVFKSKEGKILESPEGSLTESDGAGTFEYKICLSRALTSDQKVVMTVFAPVVSAENTQRGDRGVFLKDGNEYVTSMTLVFDKDHLSFNVTVVAFADLLREGNDYVAILHNIDAGGAVAVTPCRNMMVFLNDSSNTSPVQNAFVKTKIVTVDESIVSAKRLTFNLDTLVKERNVMVWAEGLAKIDNLTCKIDGNVGTIEWDDPNIQSGTRIYINYSNDYRDIDNESVIQMKYDTTQSVTGNLNLAIKTEAYEFTTSNMKNEVVECVTAQKTIQIKYSGFEESNILDQGGYVFAFVKQAVSKGDASVVFKVGLSGTQRIEYYNQAGNKIWDLDAGTEYTLSDDVTTLTLMNKTFLEDGYIIYKAALYFEAESNRTAPVSVTLVDELDLCFDESHSIEMQCYDSKEISDGPSDSCDYYYKKMGNQIVLYSRKSDKPISLTGTLTGTFTSATVYDDEQIVNPLAKYKDKVPVTENSIEEILGSVLEDGAGAFNDFATAPTMLRYRATDDRNETDVASAEEISLREKVREQREADFDEKKSIDRVFVNNMDSNLAATSSLSSLDANKVEETEDSTKDEKKLITAETALLKSDAESLQLRHQASGSDVDKNISFGNMEYGEINLGTGEDSVDINKSIYREDGFQTFTVVNSGKGGDTVNVNSYKDGSDDQLVINAGEGDDKILATDAENVTKSGLIAFGGLGNDKIEIKSESSLVFGDRGQVLYHDADGNVVTRLGDNKTGTFIGKENGVARNAGGSDYATGKKKGDEAYYQTDGTRYGASIARTVTEDQGGNDQIALVGGRNVVFGGTNDPAAVDKDNKPIVESVTTGNGEDLVFGDNGYTTFQGRSDVAKKLGMDDMPTIYSEATLSFNFQGPAQTGIAANEQAGAVADYTVKNVDETTGETVETAKHVEHHVGNWNNIKGHEAGTYGDNDDEIVLFDNGTRASAVSVSYGASEDHRVNTTDGDNIRLHGYTQEGRISANNSGDYNLMKSGLDTSGNNARNTLLAQVDGLDQYFTDYDVVVYLDMVQENSWAQNSVRVVTLYRDIVENGVARSEWVKSYYVNDPESNSFNGKWVVSTATTAEQARNAKDGEGNPEYANCVIFEGVTGDRFHVEITDGDAWNGYNNGKDRAGIAGIQVCGRLHRQDVAASTDIAHGGNDVINTQGGDDIVVGGTGADTIRTFGDDRYGIYDNDVVFGDNAKLSFTDRDGNLDTASTISYAESIASQNMSVSYDDKIMTGDGNDVVVGGSGSDKIDSGATAQADEKLDGLEVFSLNFTDVSSNQSTLISKGEAAGVVTDNDWHNAYLYNGDPRVHGTDSLGGIGFSYDCYGNTNAPTEVTNAKMDADTGNNKMMMNYVGGHNQDPLTVRLNNIRSKITAAKYDVYVYIDGINNDSDAHGYVFKITGSNGKSYYLNDWSGNRFDGDFKQVTCTDYTIGSLKDGITPSVEMIGNYVVFRDVESPNFDVTIECVDSNFGTQERNDLPVVSAVQIVAGVNREKDVAVGGDHDKDFVAGDDASLHFDLDIPFAGDENIRDYQNRLISAKSMPVSGSANNDKIWTGKDRDVVVGGEGNDQIDAGAGDDVVIGNTARNLYVEHNNPVGVFRPNVNIVLEDNDYNVAEPRPYLDGQGGNRDQIRSMVQNGQIEGISLDYQNMANDTVYGGYNNKDLVFNGNVSWENLPKELASDPFFGVQEDEVHAMPTPPAPAEEEPGGNEEPANGNEEPVNGGNDPVNGNEDPANGDEPQNTDDCSRTYIFPVAFASLELEADEKVRVVFESYPQFSDHIANLHLYFTGANGQRFEDVSIELYSHGRLYCYDVHGDYWVGVDVQDHIDGESAYGDGNCVLYVKARNATAFSLSIGE